MATIGSLTYTLVAKTDSFKQGIAGSNRALRDQKKLFLASRTDAEKFQIAIKRLEDLYKRGKISQDVYTRSLRRLNDEHRRGTVGGGKFAAVLSKMGPLLIAAVTATISFGAAIRSIRGQLGDLDQLAKLSARIGESAENISRLQFAADQTGVSAQQFSSALDVMVKRLGEASEGSGEAKKALDTLGLSADDLIKRNPADAFAEIADSISMVSTQSQKSAAVADIFSRANLDLVNTLDLGRAGLAQYADEADELGITVTENLSQIEKTNDAVSRMQKAWSGVSREVTLELAPTLEGLALLLQDVATAFNSAGEAATKFQGVQISANEGPLSLTNMGAPGLSIAGFLPSAIGESETRAAATAWDKLVALGELTDDKTDPFEALFKPSDPLFVSDSAIAFAERFADELAAKNVLSDDRASTVTAIKAGTIEALRLQTGNMRAPEERTARSTEAISRVSKEHLEIAKSSVRILGAILNKDTILSAESA